ncbi:MAG TPA: DUF2933 domain-containing protein [Motiliproteus sp.]
MANSSGHSFWLSGKGLAAIGLVGFASYFLLMEHQQHLFSFLPYLILLLCPLMHIFMHHGHGHHHRTADHSRDAHTSPADKKLTYRDGYEQGRKDALNGGNQGDPPHERD